MSAIVTGVVHDPSNPENDAAGPVDVADWSFFGRGDSRATPFLIGPIVGTVTETTAR